MSDELAARCTAIAIEARRQGTLEAARVERHMPLTFSLLNEFFTVFGRSKGWRIHLTENGHTFNYPKEGK